MTKIEMGEVTCAVCGNASSRLGLTSAFVVGHPDLDTRPGGTGRHLVGFGIQRCYSCGYTAARLADEPPPRVREVIRSPAYRAVLESESVPRAARDFLARSLIDEQVGEPASAGWNALRAAWMCDDEEGAEEAARECRTTALSLFRRAAAEGRQIAPGGNAACVITDLLRRTGRFDEALVESTRALEHETDPLVRSILAFQARLARARDAGRHDLGEVEAAGS